MSGLAGPTTMSDLNDLYQEVILDHNKRPRNFRVLEGANRRAEGFNPLCGDRLTLFLQVDGDVIREATFQGSGCAISKASASLMTDALKGKTIDQAQSLFDRFHHMVTSAPDAANIEGDFADVGKLSVLAGVREFPLRVKCASLAWHTFKAALKSEKPEVVSTE